MGTTTVVIRRLLFAFVAAVLLLIPGSATAVPSAFTPRVLIMGTSTTACVGPTDAASCYVNRVRAARPGWAVTVIGRGGTYTGWGPVAQNWTTQAIPTGHSVVVLQHGTNDWYVPVPPVEQRAHVADLMARTRAANPHALLVWVRTWMPDVSAADRVARTDMWHQHGAVTRSAVERHGGWWLDLDPTGTGGTPYRADAFHYDNAGHAVIAQRLLPYLPQIGRVARR